MSDSTVTLVLIAIALLYTALALSSYRRAVQGFLFLAPLSYFSAWSTVTFDPQRACTLILVLLCVLRYGHIVRLGRLWRHGISIILLFATATTIVNSFFWPTGSAGILSAAYGSLRVLVQLTQLGLNFLAIWCMVPFFADPGNRALFRKTVTLCILVWCGYGLYQVAAYHTGLPSTGIRRAYSKLLSGNSLDEQPLISAAGLTTIRANSFLGEPKGFGAACAFWLAALTGTARVRKKQKLALLAYALAATGLVTSYSTSAWAVFCLGLLAAITKVAQSRRNILFLALASATIVLVTFTGAGTVAEALFRSRTVERVSTVSDVVGDFAEIQTIAILEARPVLAVVGAGMGGISFYIEDRAQTQSGLTFAPNNGVLYMVSNVGVAGLLLYALLLWGPLLRAALSRRKREYDWIIPAALMGVCQTLVHGSEWISIVSLAMCVAITEFRGSQSDAPLYRRLMRTGDHQYATSTPGDFRA